MKQIEEYGKYKIFQLDKKAADTYSKEITLLVNAIPAVEYTEEDILAESKGERVFYGKWEHSLVIFDGNVPIAVIIGYEREKEDNNQYPGNSIYISELAVDENYRQKGIARKIIKAFLELNRSFLHLDGEPIFMIQTNSADWNKHVVNLYKSFGFEKSGKKEYDNRMDVILEMKP